MRGGRGRGEGENSCGAGTGVANSARTSLPWKGGDGASVADALPLLRWCGCGGNATDGVLLSLPWRERHAPLACLARDLRSGGAAATVRGATKTRVGATLISLNSHPVFAPYMAQLVMLYELSSNIHWGWPSGNSYVPTLVRQGFETGCNDFFIFALATIAEIPTWIFYDRNRNDLYRNRLYRR